MLAIIVIWPASATLAAWLLVHTLSWPRAELAEAAVQSAWAYQHRSHRHEEA
jgi:hypothetical protein